MNIIYFLTHLYSMTELRDTLISAFSANFKLDDGKYITIIRNNINLIYSAINNFRHDKYHKYFIVSTKLLSNNTSDNEYYILKDTKILARFINNIDHYNIIFDIISDTIAFYYISINDISNSDIIISGSDCSILIGNKCNILQTILDDCNKRNIKLYILYK